MGKRCKRHCLLMAVQLGILHKKMSKNAADSCRFARLVNGHGKRAKQRRKELVDDMLWKMGTYGIEYPRHEQTYTVDEHVPIVQRYLDRRYPRKFRLSVFGNIGRSKPLWKGPKRARQELSLYLKNGHYRAIRKLDSFFGAPYCVDCEATYDDKTRHRASCEAKCPRCCGMGSLEFPCANEANYVQECTECNNIFRNRRCFKRHLRKNICRQYKRLVLCAKVFV